jgi:hypothetical protein
VISWRTTGEFFERLRSATEKRAKLDNTLTEIAVLPGDAYMVPHEISGFVSGLLCRFTSAILVSIPLAATQVHSAEGGYSNYLPGAYGDFGMALAPPDGWTLRNDLYYYTADADETVRSGRVEADVELDILMNMTSVFYKTDFTLFGGQYVAGVAIPWVRADIEAGIELGPIRQEIDASDSGLGDVTLIPLALYWNEGRYHWAFTHSIVTPTGDYDADNDVNPGLNYWSFDTNFALTYLNEETGKDLSFNLGYIYNTENDDTDYQTGQELHLDFVFNQFLSESFAIGLHGFYLKQITGDSGSGALLGDFKAEAAGVGPAAMWSRAVGDQEVVFIAKWIHEFHAERRLEGDHFYLSFALSW